MIFLLIALLIAIGSARSLLRAICIKKDNVSPVFASAVFLAVPGCFVALYSLAFLEIDFSAAARALPYTLITIPCFFIGTALQLKALKQVEASLSTIVGEIVTLAGLVAFAYLFLNETLFGWQWLGFVCLTAGIFLTHSVGRRHADLAKGLSYLSLGSVLTAMGLIVDKMILDLGGVGTFLFVSPGIICLASIIFYYAWQRWHKSPLKPPAGSIRWAALLGTAALGTVSLYIYIVTLDTLDNIAYVNVATSFTIVLSVILAVLFFKEFTDFKIKLAGLAIAITGLVLL
ncbi:DMT family transporter [Candidatus Saccharibacteria bacterium]|nr:DMT family transporter [Candidatus Saccharibacteria bacterium]